MSQKVEKKYWLGWSILAATGFIALSLVVSTTVAQLTTRPQSLELSCVHIYPIKMKYLEKHASFSTLNKNLESRVIDQFIKRLDNSKLYLMEKDVQDMQKALANIFQKTREKDCEGIKKAHDRFKQRVADRAEYAKKYLGKKFKFDSSLKITLDPEQRPRAKSVAEANKFHETYMQYQVATYLATDMKEDEAKQQVIRNYERVQKRMEEMKSEDMWALYVDAYARSLDPHSSYLSRDQLEDFEIQMRLSLEGIGATLSSRDGFTVIEQLLPGGAAFESGLLRPKDKIIAVAQGEKGEYSNVIERELREVVRLIRGKKGSKVRLRVLRKVGGESERFEVTLVRDQIKLEDDAASITYMDREIGGQKKKVALISLPSFYADNRKGGASAASDVRRLLAEANKEKADAVVLDMSNNGGGSLRDAVDIAGLFFSSGNVVKQSQRVEAPGQKVEYDILRDTDEKVHWAGPLVVLVSRISASASEIVSGTLQDYRRAVVVGGDHTFGKGSVQSVEYLPPGLGAVKTTVGMFFIPGGNSTQHDGVSSDIVFPNPYSNDDIGEKTLDYSLPPKKIRPFLSKSAYVDSGPGAWAPLEKEIIKKLKQASELRLEESEEFKKIREDIAKAEERGRQIVLSDLLNDSKSEGKEQKNPDLEAEEENFTLSREERKKKYLERADVNEAVTVAAELAVHLSQPKITLGAKDKKVESRSSEASAN